jgi:BsuBI/PstI restriction endonuclease domain/BsuBI/PstI restriction endonuclease HTH domain
MTLPPVSPVQLIHERLQSIYPEGSPNRTYCVREMAAKTIFVMLYVGAVTDRDRWIRPDQVTRMTDDQSSRTTDEDREAWAVESMKPSKSAIPGRWYAANTREPIRDETLREGLIPTGAVKEREGIATTSAKPRYAVTPDFAGLFDPELSEDALEAARRAWQKANLSAGALARIALVRGQAVASDAGLLISFPSGETRRMVAGPSSNISKAVIEEFAPRFLEVPGVVFLSESANKIVSRDDQLARRIGLRIDVGRNLPDIILADLGPDHPLLVFVEVVATDGPIGETRKAALLRIAEQAGFSPAHVTFVTAYLDRSAAAFKKTVDALAWGTFAWFMSEPDHLLRLYEGGAAKVRRLSDWS